MTPVNTRDKILEVAARLFHEHGFGATGVSTILREAGVNSGSLYHFFPSKEALLTAVLDRYVELLEPEVMAEPKRRESDPLARVFALLQGYREGLEWTGGALGCPVGNLALEVADTHPEVRGKIERNFENWCREVEGWLVQAGDRLPRAVDRASLARFVLTVMEGAIMQVRSRRTLEPFDHAVATLRDYFDRLGEAARLERAASGGPKSRR